jgi:hypothetical protein
MAAGAATSAARQPAGVQAAGVFQATAAMVQMAAAVVVAV